MISERHLDVLAASGVTVEHAAARGYETITDKRWFINSGLKITPAGRSVPSLLVPLLRKPDIDDPTKDPDPQLAHHHEVMAS